MGIFQRRKAILEAAEIALDVAVSEGQLTEQEARAARWLVRWSPKFRNQLIESVEKKKIGVDFDALLAFIKELIPLILELIKLFSNQSP